ncbi:Zn-ribbon domain-containing OB-fold protein [Mycobacterium sp. pUA109]|uniref:Zn-ribbon domain-containing OB-fold protein n=1 Tax=Mycobacterium sp. pUA109 TaxID=3238982 RepID=UPI00351B94F6
MPTEPDSTSPTPLHIEFCVQCARWVRPATDTCPDCRTALVARPVSGRGTVFTYTVNHHRFDPSLTVPYVIAIIELVEQEGLRVAANVVDCEPDSVACGMPVQARFDGDAPVFVPV